MSNWMVTVEGLTGLDEFDGTKQRIRVAAARAINKITRDGRVEISELIREDVKFPASYLSAAQKRLWVSKYASESDLEGRITARGRATSLARFAESSPARGAGVTVEVHRGKAKLMKRAFLIRLRAGNADIDTKSNLGLAIRLKPGEAVANKTSAVRMQNGLYLLYGPSVDQVFRANDGGGVASNISPKLANKLADEFLRLVEVF